MATVGAPPRARPDTVAVARPAPRSAPLAWVTADARATLALLTVAALVVPAALVRSPTVTMGAVVGVVGLVAVVLRLEAAFLLLVAVAPFEKFVAGVGGPNAVKAVGLLVFAAWALRALGTGSSGLRRHPALAAAAALALAVLLSGVAHLNGGSGLVTLIRYLSFLGTFVVAVSLLRDRPAAWRVAAVFVAACTASSLSGLSSFFSGAEARAGGPLDDPNDLAYFLASAIPLALALASRARGRGALGTSRWWLLATVLLATGIAGTLSRGATVGVMVVTLWAVWHRLVRPRLVVVGVAALVVVLGGVALAVPALVDRALHQKATVAGANVDTRAARWIAASEMFFDHPFTGVGPAGFGVLYTEYAPGADEEGPTVAHQMYLDVASELGGPGIVAFLALVGLSFRGAVRHTRRSLAAGDADGALLGWAVRGSLVVILTASMFLTEQYYLPLWMMCAFGVALELGPVERDAPAVPA